MEKETNSLSKQTEDVSPAKQKVKVALNWTLNIVCVILIIFALVMAIFTIVRATNPDGITNIGGNCYFNVMSDSMDPTFCEADVIIAREYKGNGKDIKPGVVITFKSVIAYSNGNKYEGFNTHRVVTVLESNGNVTGFVTRGDNQDGSWKDCVGKSASDLRLDGQKVETINLDDVVATWGSVDDEGEFTSGKLLKGVGGFSNWIQEPEKGKTRFFCVVVLPLILLFVIYAFILVRTLIIAKINNNKKVQGEAVSAIDALSDEEKRRLAEEYLATLAANKDQESSEHSAEPVEEAPAEEPAAPVEESAEPLEEQSEESHEEPASETEQPKAEQPSEEKPEE